MSESNSTDQAKAPGGATDVQAGQNPEQIAAFWQHAGPIIQPLATAAIQALEQHGRNTGRLTALLLGLVIATFGGLAWKALDAGYIDTAEKVLIALISFLGGAAMFSGAPKK